MAYIDTVKTASQVIGSDDSAKQNALTAASVTRANGATGGAVTHSEYVDYETKLSNYQTRDDVEPLAERRARDNGTVAQQSFRRQGKGSGAVFTSPADGNVGAPESHS